MIIYFICCILAFIAGVFVTMFVSDIESKKHSPEETYFKYKQQNLEKKSKTTLHKPISISEQELWVREQKEKEEIERL